MCLVEKAACESDICRSQSLPVQAEAPAKTQEHGKLFWRDSDAPPETSLKLPITQPEIAGELFDTRVAIAFEEKADGGFRDRVHRRRTQNAE
jgi:hypothetical protein